eukprot:TRINITY_DN29090_c0_g1_i1.p2 TRINITY_DN29090_c0_g1~~TRINITY_DN29090_c0_g1_i1.p2  ORF type:complete len:132 (-),score=5.34 TRINITY_DN29090_c0_g1_i1:293-688(-)
MGLTSWKVMLFVKQISPQQRITLKRKRQTDQTSLQACGLTMRNGRQNNDNRFFMKDWQERLDAFLKFNEYKILQNAGHISKRQADDYARNQYEQFESQRRTYIENQAEEEYIKDLEEAAKQLPSRNKGGSQ